MKTGQKDISKNTINSKLIKNKLKNLCMNFKIMCSF